jgi:hypothetical protein
MCSVNIPSFPSFARFLTDCTICTTLLSVRQAIVSPFYKQGHDQLSRKQDVNLYAKLPAYRVAGN